MWAEPSSSLLLRARRLCLSPQTGAFQMSTKQLLSARTVCAPFGHWVLLCEFFALCWKSWLIRRTEHIPRAHCGNGNTLCRQSRSTNFPWGFFAEMLLHQTQTGSSKCFCVRGPNGAMYCRLRKQSGFELITDEMIKNVSVLGRLLITLCLTWVSKTHKYHLIQYLCLKN